MTRDGYQDEDNPAAHRPPRVIQPPPATPSAMPPPAMPAQASVRAPSRGPGWILMVGVWALVFVSVWAVLRPQGRSPLHDPSAKPRPVVARGDLDRDERETVDVFRESSPSVVYITSTELARDFFGFNVFEVPRGTGSGFVYDSDGHIVTNYHVVADAKRIVVTLADESQWEAELVGEEPDKDLAVLKIDAPAEKLKPIALGTSHDLQVGQRVMAIGNPFGFDRTLTVGVVSALGREIEAATGRKIRGVIQTDAAINPGNSGGPLLDSAGRLIGVNTQIASPSGVSAGIGFAVPVDTVNDVVPQLIRFGRVPRVGLGVVLFPEWRTRRAGIPGLLIDTVRKGSGADQAGLLGTIMDNRGRVRQVGDAIVRIDDRDVSTLNELKDVLEPYAIGDKINVVFRRNNKLHQATVSLEQVN